MGVCSLLWASLAWSGCAGDKSPDLDGLGDADADADSDTDTDTDTDTDSDTDADTDSDADTDTDTGQSSCIDLDLGSVVPQTVDASTVGAGDDLLPPCSYGNSEDFVFGFTAPGAGRYRFDTEGSELDTVLTVYDGCTNSALACNDDADLFGGVLTSVVTVTLAAGQSVAAVVDAYDASGPITLSVVELPLTEPLCDDGQDEDEDGRADCLDPDCAGVGTCTPQCPDLTVAGALPAVVSGTTDGLPDESVGSCDLLSGYAPSPDASVAFVAPADGRYAFSLASGTDFDSLLYVLDVCGGAERACDDEVGLGGETVAVELVTDQAVVAVVDGYGSDAGAFTLSVFLVQGNEVGACADGLDNDVDGAPDCADSDCDPEPSCLEICDNLLDDDGNGHLDCLDEDCGTDPFCDEPCPEDTLPAPPSTSVGSSLGGSNDLAGSCGGSAASDRAFLFTAPAAGTYTFDTLGSTYDTVLYVLDGECGGAELGCNDDSSAAVNSSELQVTLAQDQAVIVVVDGYDASSAGTFVLNIQ